METFIFITGMIVLSLTLLMLAWITDQLDKVKRGKYSKYEKLEDKLNIILGKLGNVATKQTVMDSKKELTRWIRQMDQRELHRLREFISKELKEKNNA